MARPPLARAKLLDAYVQILNDEGERAATMDATAARAEVSKGGLLYHFASKDALAQAVVDVCEELAREDARKMREAQEGASVYYVRTSVDLDTEFDRYLLAVQRLAQSGFQAATDTLKRINAQWLQLVLDEVQDPTIAQAVILIGEGLYAQYGRPASWDEENFDQQLNQLLELVPKLKKLGNFNK